MKNPKITLLALLTFLALIPQITSAAPAIIKDKDGYTNVRKSASSKSAVVCKILDNEVFNTRSYDRKGNWVAITFNNKTGKEILGYIHSSRVLPLSKIRYKGKDITFKVTLQPFQKDQHKITRSTPSNPNSPSLVTAIDNLHVWGTDGGLPTTETASIKISINGSQIPVNQSLYANLYQMHADPPMICRQGKTYFIVQSNSDGAGSYQSIWVVSKKTGCRIFVYDFEG